MRAGLQWKGLSVGSQTPSKLGFLICPVQSECKTHTDAFVFPPLNRESAKTPTHTCIVMQTLIGPTLVATVNVIPFGHLKPMVLDPLIQREAGHSTLTLRSISSSPK